jgi:hypothetical protein
VKAHVLYVASLLLAGAQLAAQQEPTPSEASPHVDFIEFIAVSPSADTSLAPGKKVALEVSVEYELVSRPTALVRVIALDAKRKTIAEFDRVIVKRGRNTYRSRAKVKIPKAEDPIHIVAELYEEVTLHLSSDSPPEALEAWAIATPRRPRRIAAAAVQFETRQGTLSALPVRPASTPASRAAPQTRESQNLAGHSTGLNFDPQGADFTTWVNRFKDEVYRNWIIPQAAVFGAARGHVDLEFTIEKDGTMSALRVVKSSRSASLDIAPR